MTDTAAQRRVRALHNHIDELEAQLAAARESYSFVAHHRETLEAWLRGCEAHIWEPTPATQDVLASLLRLVLLAGTTEPADNDGRP